MFFEYYMFILALKLGDNLVWYGTLCICRDRQGCICRDRQGCICRDGHFFQKSWEIFENFLKRSLLISVAMVNFKTVVFKGCLLKKQSFSVSKWKTTSFFCLKSETNTSFEHFVENIDKTFYSLPLPLPSFFTQSLVF